jgi:deoxyribodipyrimidine photo-lyase
MTAIVWFRNDLRLQDNQALYEACKKHSHIIPLYIRDFNSPMILGANQKWWLHNSLITLQDELKSNGLQLCFKSGDAVAIVNQLIKDHEIKHVYWNYCYESAHMQQDAILKSVLEKEDIVVTNFNASLLIEPESIKNKQGDNYKVFTPFWKECLKKIHVPDALIIDKWPKCIDFASENLDSWNLLKENSDKNNCFSKLWQPGEKGAHEKLDIFIHNSLNQYPQSRDIPAQDGTSKISPHLHFGEISPHQIWRELVVLRQNPKILDSAIDKFLAEIGWREFSYYMLYHFPKLPKNGKKA